MSEKCLGENLSSPTLLFGYRTFCQEYIPLFGFGRILWIPCSGARALDSEMKKQEEKEDVGTGLRGTSFEQKVTRQGEERKRNNA